MIIGGAQPRTLEIDARSWALSSRFALTDDLAVDVRRVGLTGERHRVGELGSESLEQLAHARFAVDRERP